MNITEVSQVHKVNTLIRSIHGSPYDINLVDKITGVNSSDQLNGGYGSAKIDFDEATLYPFQYLTIKPQYYTKHYFIGNEHIAMTFGNGGFENVTPNTERKPETVHESQLMYWFYNMQWNDPYVFRTNTVGETTKNIDYQGSEFSDLQYKCSPTIVADLYASWRPRLHNVIGNNLGILNKQEEPYFYHNDHLGSTKLVMDGRGRICNEIDYMPFGEIFHPDRGNLEEHKFTGKERDEETQYDYFGARYYWSAAKHWLTVDPLSDKYPGISPYAYCGWNPINYVDPDGKEKISFFSNEQHNELKFAESYPDDNRLHLFFHGYKNGTIQLNLSNHILTIPATSEGAQKLSLVLSNKTSEIWYDYLTERVPIQVVLHGCYTEKMAEALSLEFPNAYFTGTTTAYFSENNKEIGPYTLNILGMYILQGAWNTYKDGKLVRSEKNETATPILDLHNVPHEKEYE